MNNDQIDWAEMRKNQDARDEAARINTGGKPGEYTTDMWNRIKGNLNESRIASLLEEEAI